MLRGRTLAEIDSHAVAEHAISDTAPFDDHHASAEYRRTVGKRIFARTLREALDIREVA
jgi:carbon-monoxide dehydrogenase medium subunit